MTTSTSEPVYVWAWLRGESTPVPAGVLERRSGSSDLSFRYGEKYMRRTNALPLYGLPFDGPTWHGATANLGMPAAIRDAAPDAWGRRVILQSVRPQSQDANELDEVIYLMRSGSNRLGALDFQASPRDYVPRVEAGTLDQLLSAAAMIEAGVHVPAHLERALLHGTAIGGARPKALLVDGGRQLLAKFSSSTDPYDVVGAEAASIYLAARAGIAVTDAALVQSLGRKVLVMDRFDRIGVDAGHDKRRMVVTGLTILRLPEQWLPVGSYPALVDALTKESSSPRGVNADVFRRVAFNIAIGNTDDHLRNHAAFWDGKSLDLTPAYDLSPVLRSGEVAAQALALDRAGNRTSSLNVLINAAPDYRLDRSTARAIALEVTTAIRDHWSDAAEFGRIAPAQQTLMWGRMFLNPGSVRGFE